MDRKKQLEFTKNFVWSLSDELGKGAYGAVYKCRNRKTGELGAVKVSKSDSEPDRKERVIMSELKHDNIVKVLAIEPMESNGYGMGRDVMIMEYCCGKSLHHYLEEPDNCYGMMDKYFIIFLRDITNALKYLHRRPTAQRIVHRDIKPLNILMNFRSNGELIFKLSDFGTAKIIGQNQEQVGTLVGTPEYLQPDMFYHYTHQPHYIRGTFNATGADLWPLGTSIYYAACGSLPFLPYGSLADDATKRRMCNLIENKPEGMISGVQKKLSMDPKYSNKLPETCRLSKHLQMYIVPFLAKLLVPNPDADYAWSDVVEQITDRKVIHYFIPHLGHLGKLYIEGKISDDSIWTEVSKMYRENITRTRFEIWWKGFPLSIKNITADADEISSEEPVMIVGKTFETWADFQLDYPYESPEGLCTVERHDPGEDRKLARIVTGKIMRTKALASHLFQIQVQLRKYYHYFEAFIKFRGEAICKPSVDLAIITTHVASMCNLLKEIRDSLPENATLPHFNDPFLKIERMCLEANGIQRNGESLISRLDDLGTIFSNASGEIREKTCTLDCERKMECMANAANSILSDFKKDLEMAKELRIYDFTSSECKNFAYVHKLDKTHLEKLDTECTKHLEDYCADSVKILSSDMHSWSSNIYELIDLIDRLEEDYKGLQELKETLQKWTDQYRNQLSTYIRERVVRLPVSRDSEEKKNTIFKRARDALEESEKLLTEYRERHFSGDSYSTSTR